MEGTSQILGSFIGGRLATYDPTMVDPRPPARAVVIRDADEGGAIPVQERRPLPANAPSEPVAAPGDPLAAIAAHLAKITRLTQSLGPDDRRRSREMVAACGSLLAASTRLDGADQNLFQDALMKEPAR